MENEPFYQCGVGMTGSGVKNFLCIIAFITHLPVVVVVFYFVIIIITYQQSGQKKKVLLYVHL